MVVLIGRERRPFFAPKDLFEKPEAASTPTMSDAKRNDPGLVKAKISD